MIWTLRDSLGAVTYSSVHSTAPSSHLPDDQESYTSLAATRSSTAIPVMDRNLIHLFPPRTLCSKEPWLSSDTLCAGTAKAHRDSNFYVRCSQCTKDWPIKDILSKKYPHFITSKVSFRGQQHFNRGSVTV